MSVQEAIAKIRRWREDPVFFVRDQFGVEPDDWQADALKAFADVSKPRIELLACAGPGKSTVLAWCILNFLTCYAKKGQHPNGAVMSITADNLKDNLWKELAVWHGRSEYFRRTFTWTKERIFANEHPETWFVSARTFSKTADAEEQGRTLSGLHSRFILYAIDESGDINPAVLRSAEQGLSNCEWGKIIQAGNPTSHEGMLYLAATKQRAMWEVIRVTGDPDDPKRSKRINIDWAREQIKQYGRDNPWVMAYILGQFPPASINTLLGPDEVEAAMDRHVREDHFAFSQKRLGVDVARFGDDKTVIFPRQGLVAFHPVQMRNARSNEVAARIAQAKAKWGSEVELIDVTGGYGAGVEDALRQAGINSIPVNFSGKPMDARYFNKRSEIWFLMAEWVKRGGALPPMPELVNQLTAPTYTFVGGKFRLEEKDQIKKRTGSSPDDADALACTFALADMPASGSVRLDNLGTKQRSVSDWDPFEEKRLAHA